jgi:His-Xaa-Ser repeat protein HxsA
MDGATAPSAAARPTLTVDEKRRLQVMRVQIKLNSLHLYDGQVDGVFNDATKQALKLFQKVKALPDTGLMTTPTLNALGISAVK